MGHKKYEGLGGINKPLTNFKYNWGKNSKRKISEECLRHKEWRMENLWFIEDLVTNDLVLFKMKPEQKLLFDSWEAGKKEVTGTQDIWREIILKARQMGTSTFALVYMMDDVTFNKNWRAGVISHDKASAKKLLRKIKVMWEHFPLADALRNDVDVNNEEEFSIKSTNSGISVGLSYRGGTLNHLHVSELGKMSSKYPLRAEEVITGAIPAITPGGMATIESTAEGVGGHFYEMWNDSPGNGYKRHFFPWFNEWKYEKKFEGDITEKFLEIQKKYSLSNRKISWYYAQSKILKDLLFQEYPSCSEEAFLQSGRPVFDMSLVRRCNVEMPKAMYSYAVGVDTATGLASDFSVATIVCKETGQQVSTHRRKDTISIFSKKVVELAILYNNAVINIELNGVGIAMKEAVEAQGYTNLHLDQSGYDKATKKYTNRLGTVTTSRSKEAMMVDVRRGFEDGYLKISDEKTYTELAAFQFDEKGKMSAPVGSHDDCFVAGTKILTNKGQVPIEKIKVGDLVMTRDGFKPVIMTRDKLKKVVKNIGLIGTPDHPIITKNQGEVPLKKINDTSILYIWNEKLFSIEEKNFIDILTQKEDSIVLIIGNMIATISLLFLCIVKYGGIILEKYLRVLLFTIKTGILLITNYLISKVWGSQSIVAYTYLPHKEEKNLQKEGKRTPKELLQQQINLEIAKKEKLLTEKMLKVVCSIKHHKKQFVYFAKKSLCIPLNAVGNFVKRFVGKGIIGKRRVYNLQVADKQEYFANNILVHNCVMALFLSVRSLKDVYISGYKSERQIRNSRAKRKRSNVLSTSRKIKDGVY